MAVKFGCRCARTPAAWACASTCRISRCFSLFNPNGAAWTEDVADAVKANPAAADRVKRAA